MTTTNPYLEKSASLLAGAALTHLVQNVATNQALKNKKVAKYLANSLTQGYHGVVDTSIKAKATRAAASVVVPDVAAAHKAAHQAGASLKDILSGATNRQRAASRMAVEGKFEQLKKYKMHEDPVVKKVQDLAAKHLPTLNDISKGASKSLSDLWKDKTHPLLSNIAKNIGRGEVPKGPQFKVGNMNQTLPTLSSIAIAPIEPSAAAIDGIKALAGSSAVQSTQTGKKAVDFLRKTFIDDPLKKGMKAAAEVKGLKHEASKFLLNPTSAHLKRTAAAVSQAAKSSQV